MLLCVPVFLCTLYRCSVAKNRVHKNYPEVGLAASVAFSSGSLKVGDSISVAMSYLGQLQADA